MAGSGSSSTGEDKLLWLHAAATAFEVLAVIALWAYQGMFSPCAGSRFLKRIRERLRLPAGQEWRDVCIVGACGTFALAAFGLATGFMRPGLPESLEVAVKTFFMLFVAPGLFEEVIFRCLLLPTEDEEKGTSPGYGGAVGARMLPVPAALVGEDIEVSQVEEGCSRACLCAAGGKRTERVVHHGPTEYAEELPPAAAPPTTDGCGGRTRRQWLEQAAALAIFMVYHLDFVHSPPLFRDPRFLVMALILGVSCQESLVRSGSVWPGAVMHWFWVWGWLTFGSPPKM